MGSEGEGSVKLRYNHYNQAFPIVDGLLKWAAVDDEYCISFVFQGDYKKTVCGPDGALMEACALGFKGLTDGLQYELALCEDEELGVGNPQLSRTYVPPSSAARSQCPFHKNANSAELTRQLKGLSSEDLRNQTEEYKQLREARDLEDLLFSGR